MKQETLIHKDCPCILANPLCRCTGIAELGTNIVKHLTKGIIE